MNLTSNKRYVRFVPNNIEQASFVQKYVRDFYSIEIAKWQYGFSSQNIGLFFLELNGSLIASQGMIPIKLSFKNHKILSAKSETSFLLPEHRGQGHFEQLYFYTVDLAAKDNIQFIWGFTALSKVWRKKLSFDVFDGLIYESTLQVDFIRDLKFIAQSTSSVINKLKSFSKSVVFYLKRKKRTFKATESKIKVLFLDTNHDRTIKELTSLYREWEEENESCVKINMDADFLKWRVMNNLKVKYKIVGFFEDQQLIGAGIINVSSEKYYLVDFITLNKVDIETCFSILLDFLKEQENFSHLVYWGSNLNKHTRNVHQMFKRRGAQSVQSNLMNFVLKKTRGGYDNVNASDFYINGLWTEGFTI